MCCMQNQCLQASIIQAARVFIHALVVGAVAFATPLSLFNNLTGEGCDQVQFDVM
jgi:hypothetical protein